MNAENLECNIQELAIRLAKDDLLSTSPDLQEFLACNVVSLIEIERSLANLAKSQPADSETRVSLAALQIRIARLRVAIDFVERGIFSGASGAPALAPETHRYLI
jgi:hypothetical protein